MDQTQHDAQLAAVHAESRIRLRLEVAGVVQGVGFRPFVYRLARRLRIAGWVANAPRGVTIEAESTRDRVEAFALEIERAPLSGAAVRSVQRRQLAPASYRDFEIRATLKGGRAEAALLPDRALCGDCRRELFDPRDRRYRYPFNGCTACGPRYAVAEKLPFDRTATTMARFAMCDLCSAEYEDPDDRRFHAQLNCCAQCGPQVALWAPDGVALDAGEGALSKAVAALLGGAIVAVKGIGGFHLMADATNADAVARLRERKQRARKPFALMFPGLAAIEAVCQVDVPARASLESAEAPIVVLRRRCGAGDAFPGVAPGLDLIGAMLPYTPLHHLLMDDVGRTLIATSGNRAGEPLCIDEAVALRRLAGISDLFLLHDRPIVRELDDSIVRPVCGRALMLRRARGFAPEPIVHHALPAVLAVGAHLKSTVALGTPRGIEVSEHLGDLDSVETRERHARAIAHILARQRSDPPADSSANPVAIAVDLHPEYASARLLATGGQRVVGVQHHYAHALACMADNRLEGRVLAVVWDGAGFGTDGTIWGGEFLCVDDRGFERYAHLRAFALPGGHKAIAEPRRTALSILWECFGRRALAVAACARAFSVSELRVLATMLERGLNSPRTTSAGRLFDALSALLGLCYRNDYEGEAAMALESAVIGSQHAAPYPFRLVGERPLVVDWTPTFESLLGDIGVATIGEVASRFHSTLAEIVAAVAQRAGIERVVLTGGCFQNACLLERSVSRLERLGLRAFWHRELPPNDGGIAPGQVIGAVRALAVQPAHGAGAGTRDRFVARQSGTQ